ncbi:CAP domain-containing protein [Tundrisphaera sp. TA3]|uniref:CAP domain-containing protein n=1 Tax=Tundrisphaera sp. TA3 TaxID=3435775 RepID=UPI003EBF8140
MRNLSIVTFLACTFGWGVVLACPASGEDPPRPDPVVVELVEAHNRERAEAKLPPLTLEPKLQTAALKHAQDMAEHETMSHEGSDKSTPAQRVEKAGYIYRKTAENVAWGQPDVATVMKGWMESPHHKENILGDYTEIGVARAMAANGAPYWSVSFGRPPLRLDPDKAAADLVARLNEERVKSDRPSVLVDAGLTAKAREVAGGRARSKDAPPPSFDGIDAKRWKTLAMNTAAGPSTPEELVRSLLENEDQKKNLLGDASRIGVGYASAEDGTAHWCLILGVPRGKD